MRFRYLLNKKGNEPYLYNNADSSHPFGMTQTIPVISTEGRNLFNQEPLDYPEFLRRYSFRKMRGLSSPSLAPGGKDKCSGFALAEVLVSVTIMAFLMISLLNFVSYAGDAWQRSQMSISLTAEANTVFELIDREMNYALDVSKPSPGDQDYALYFSKVVRDSCSPYHSASASFRIVASGRELTMDYLNSIEDIDAGGGWAGGTADGDKLLNTDRYEFPFARHLQSINFDCVSPNQLDVELTLKTVRETDGLEREIKMVKSFLMPQQ